MAYFIFAGDMFVMAFMTALVVWISIGESDTRIDDAARIPLEDESCDR